jgi:hypothetical protein
MMNTEQDQLHRQFGRKAARRGGWRVLALPAVVVVAAAAIIYVWTARQSRPDDSFTHYHSEMRDRSLATIRMRDGSTLSLADGKSRVLYLFSTTCAVCQAQRAHVAELLAAVPSDAVITGSTEPRIATAAYWSAFDDSLAAPVSVDSAWLQALGLPDGSPILLFTTRDGRIGSLVSGSVMTWSPKTVHSNYLRAAVRETP